jgi:pSer/pThr/pTyr-binding forkhead associated (FHA) protein
MPQSGGYIILEALSNEKRNTVGIHAISMNHIKKNIKLGRGHDSDVRISDISISRCHAIIKQKSDG